jgi:hypothetical protein
LETYSEMSLHFVQTREMESHKDPVSFFLFVLISGLKSDTKLSAIARVNICITTRL